MLKKVVYIITLAVAVITGCKKPYDTPAIISPNSYLVVDGVINSGADSSFIMLSRTINLLDSIPSSGETGAEVSVLVNGGTTYAFKEIRNGVYAHMGLNIGAGSICKLKIRTKGQDYMSDDIIVKNTPAIDSIGFEPVNDVLQINVNTHDPDNNTRYYKWDYEDAWRFTTKYRSGFIYDASLKDMRKRTVEEDIYTCYNTGVSSTINIGSTVKLDQDVVSKALVESIPGTSLKLNSRYTILVKQYALSKEAYAFWENLKKNTEQLGGVFDPLPSEIGGNIHNVNNPREPVIGFVLASNVQTKRIYIDKSQLPNWETKYSIDCQLDSTLYYREPMGNEVAYYLYPPSDINFLATSAIIGSKGMPGFYRTFTECADCRVFGRKKPPLFWKEK